MDKRIVKPFITLILLLSLVSLACNLPFLTKATATSTAGEATVAPSKKTGAVTKLSDVQKAVVQIESEGTFMRVAFTARHRRIPLLHRNGQDYLLSPGSERLTRVNAVQFKRFGPYRDSEETTKKP